MIIEVWPHLFGVRLSLGPLFLFYQTKIIPLGFKAPSVKLWDPLLEEEQSLNTLIDCFLNQNYAKEVEFILVDDESSDNTSSIIKDIEKKDKRFKYVSSLDGNQKLKYKLSSFCFALTSAGNIPLLICKGIKYNSSYVQI